MDRGSLNPPVPGARVSQVGEMLRAARQEQRLSLLDAAQAIHIKANFLDALENGEYSLLPGPAYITGFLRNYARYLGLHPDDVVQEYYATRPLPEPMVRPATRVLASGYQRHNRTRLLWGMLAVVALLVGAFTIKQYNDSTAHASPQLNVTPANLGMTGLHHAAPPTNSTIRLGLHAIAPVWVRVTVDGHRKFEGIMRARDPWRRWTAHTAVYVLAFDGAHLQASYDSHKAQLLSRRPGLSVWQASAAGWRQAS